MNNNVNGTSSMGPNTSMPPSSSYGSDSWTSVSPYSASPYSQSPLTEHNAYFGAFVPHGLPSESLTRMPPPPSQIQAQAQAHQQQQHQHHQQHQILHSSPMGHQQLPILNTTWPSQLTNPSPSGSYSAPPISLTPVSAAPSIEAPAPKLPTQAPHEKSRKTLTAEQKRAMCQFHEDNPGTRQADIGARFGVERSTVSKVLRHRDQYLKREPEPEHPPAKRQAKPKHPDFDRTLSNYVRRQQQRGFEVNDDEILEQAKLFARVSGNADSPVPPLTGSWLQKFKQKHGIGAGKLMRRASETNIPDSARMSTMRTNKSDTKSTNGVSPASPSGQLSPLSASRSDEEVTNDGIDFEFGYKHADSQSTTSLTSELQSTAATSSFSSSTMSPTAPFTFSPDPNIGGFPLDQNHTLRSNSAADFQHRKERSNTFPSLNIDYLSHPSTTEPSTPRHGPASTAPSSALDSPAHELLPGPFAIDTNITSPPLRRTSSNSSMTGRSSVTSLTTSALGSTPLESSPVSPSQEDARRAAKTLLNYIQAAGTFDRDEYLAIVQLTKKLQIQQHQSSRPALGGLSRIPEGDTELPMLQAKMETT